MNGVRQFIEEQNGIAGGGFIGEAAQILLGLDDIRASGHRQISSAQTQSQRTGQNLSFQW